MVVVYHATIITHDTRTEPTSGLASWLITHAHRLNMGVPMFFVISGYCISAAADAARRRDRRVRTYFWRRFRRIFPPLWAMIGLGVVLFLVLDYGLWPEILSGQPWPQLRPWWYSGRQWLGNLTLTETWLPYLVGGSRGHFPGQAWTLCYEEQFYALTGLILLLAPRRFFAAGLALSTGVVIAAVACRRQNIATDGYFFDGSWLTFAAGMLVYYRANYAGTMGRWAVAGTLAAGAGLAVGGVVEVPGGEIAFPFALLLVLAHRFDAWTSGARLFVPFTFCGQMCYSLYLIHQLPVKAISNGFHRAGIVSETETLLITAPLCVAVSVTLGWCFFLAVERRFLNSPGPALATRGSSVRSDSKEADRALLMKESVRSMTGTPSQLPDRSMRQPLEGSDKAVQDPVHCLAGRGHGTGNGHAKLSP
jgi:peptidoglycan/LPS O-acetylase OafA/YrhL